MLHRLLAFLCVLALGTSISLAAPRQEAPGPIVELDEMMVVSMSEAWDRARNPKILVMFGITEGNRIRYDVRAHTLERISAPLTNELNRAFPGGLVALEIAKVREHNIIGRINRNLGDDLAPGADKALAELFDADIIIDVALLPGARRGEYAPSMRAVDTRSAVVVASSNLLSANLLNNPQIGHVYAAELARAFGEGFVNTVGQGRHGRAREYLFRLIGVDGEGGLTARDGRDIARMIENKLEHNVVRADSEESVEQDQRFILLTVRYKGLLRDLMDDIEDEILSELDLGWKTLSSQGVDVSAIVFKAERPEWHLYTDPSNPEAIKLQQRRKSGLVNHGFPKLAIVMGKELIEYGFSAASDDGAAPEHYDSEPIRYALENRFKMFGFKVVDLAALDRQTKAGQRNAEHYDNLPHLIESLKAIDDVDLILHINELNNGRDGQFIARLIEPKTGTVVGSQAWPDPAASRLNKYSVKPGEADDIARFVTGRLLARWDRHAAQDVESLDLQIRNVTNTQKILAFVDLVRTVSGVKRVVDIQISTPVAQMELLYSENTDILVLRLMESIGAAFPGAELQRLGAGLVVNLTPKTLSEQELAERREKAVSLDIDPDQADKNAQPQVHLTPQEKVTNALREARDSIWLIYIETEDGAWTGTGWTVREGLLATNAHVLGDLPERLARGEKVSAVAWNDRDRSTTLTLGRAWRHPKWNGERGFGLKEFWYDVGLIEVADGGYAGQPLQLANAQELDQLTAPVLAGYIGFPSRGTIKMKQNDLPVKQAFIGQINAILDTSLTPGSASRDRMFMHNITSAHGASGSPIFGEHGHVIGLLNSGQLASVMRMGENNDLDRDFVNTGFNGGLMVNILTDFMESIRKEIDND